MFGSGRTGSIELSSFLRAAPGCQASIHRARLSRRRSGFTLLEVMIATAVTLLMMISLVQVFKVIGDSMKQGRAALQMNNSLRSVTTRLRQDLANLTVRVDPPSDTSSGGGYFEYFDGSMTDYTAALFATDAPRSNRFGDSDDILMFTARAGTSWFTGQVPRCVVDTSIPFDPLNPQPVIITSPLAEVVVFARPTNSELGTATRRFDDVDNNGFPDSFRLHYRTLLIRPDLNLAAGAINGLVPTAADSPTALGAISQFCDLSMHRQYNPGGTDTLVANSLEDLANPANRFAHFQYALPGTAVSSSLPLLVLDPIPHSGTQGNCITTYATGLYPDTDPSGLAAFLAPAAGHFLNPAFVLSGQRLGEDIVATNILAFDVKGYDPAAPVIAVRGTDGAFGVGGSGLAGQDGSDDIVLSPNDPGYAAAFATPAASAPTVVSYGEYVDLMWGRKVLNSLGATAYGPLNYTAISGNSPNLFSALSGLDLNGFSQLPSVNAPLLQGTAASGAVGFYTDGLRRSGKALTNYSVPYDILQPTYDTWTTVFETNGTPQGVLNAGFRGAIDVNLIRRKTGSAASDSYSGTTDSGTDGLDNNGTGGVDETAERETLPPFPIKLRGIKVSVRIEDLNSRQIKQMSVASEFATQ